MLHLENNEWERTRLLRIGLQFFAEGDGGADGGADTGAGGEATPPAGGDGAAESNTQPTGSKTYTQEDAAAVAKQFGMIPHGAVKDRYKSTFDKAGKYDAVTTHMGAVAERYGVSLDDPEGLAKAILTDANLVKAKATEMGVTEEVARSVVAADAQNAMIRAREAERVRQEEFSRMANEEKAVREAYPTFDFNKASGNPAFKALVDSGLDMKTAYEMSHHAELTAAAISIAREQAKAEARAEIEANANRPKEGAAGQTGNSPTNVSELHGAALDKFLESYLSR